MANLLLALEGICLELLQAHERTLLQLLIVYEVVGSCGEHALDEVLSVTEDHPISLCSISLGSQRLNLNTLAYWYWEVCGASFGVVEDGTG